MISSRRVDYNTLHAIGNETGNGFCLPLTETADPDVRLWDMGSATDIRSMFQGARVAKPCVTKWRFAKKLTEMREAFAEAYCATPNIAEWDLPDNWQTSVVSTDWARSAGVAARCPDGSNFAPEGGFRHDASCPDDDPFRVVVEITVPPSGAADAGATPSHVVQLPLLAQDVVDSANSLSGMNHQYSFTVFWGQDNHSPPLEHAVTSLAASAGRVNLFTHDYATTEETKCEGCGPRAFECWGVCGEVWGFCSKCDSWSGIKGACCEQNNPDDPDECKDAMISFPAIGYHVCVLVSHPVKYVVTIRGDLSPGWADVDAVSGGSATAVAAARAWRGSFRELLALGQGQARLMPRLFQAASGMSLGLGLMHLFLQPKFIARF